jgi:hypothetical protein
LQQAEPSAGCAQQAPLLSSSATLGVQHAEASFFGVQQDETGATTSFFSPVIFVLLITGISKVCVSIVLLFFNYKDGHFRK